MLARHLEHHQRTVGVYRKVRERFTRGPIVTGLGRSMNNQHDLFAPFAKQFADGAVIAHIQRVVLKVFQVVL